MTQNNLQIGDIVCAHVTGEYALQIEVMGVIKAFYSDGKRVKIKTSTGHCYMVHVEDCQKVEIGIDLARKEA